MLVVQSEYGDLCHLFMQRVDLGDFTIIGGDSSGNVVSILVNRILN